MKEAIAKMSAEQQSQLYPILSSDWFSQTHISQLNFDTLNSIKNKYYKIESNENSSLKILDWGCGNLLWALGLFPEATEIVGIELSEKNLSYAISNKRLNNPNAKFNGLLYQDYVQNMYENYFDYAICFGLIEMIDLEEFEHIFSQIYRSLKPGGSLFITSHNFRQLSAVYLPYIFRGGYKGLCKQCGFSVSTQSLIEQSEMLGNLSFKLIERGAFNPYPSKFWKYIRSKKRYITNNIILAHWYYTQYIVVKK